MTDGTNRPSVPLCCLAYFPRPPPPAPAPLEALPADEEVLVPEETAAVEEETELVEVAMPPEYPAEVWDIPE